MTLFSLAKKIYHHDLPPLARVIFFMLRLALVIAIFPLFFAPRSDFDLNFPTTWQTVNEVLEMGHVVFFFLVASVTVPLVVTVARFAALRRNWRDWWTILPYAWQRIEAQGESIPAPWVWLITLVVTFSFGFYIELAQGSFTSECLANLTSDCLASLGDVFHDMVGVVIYLLWWQSRYGERFRLGLRLLILPPLLVAALPIALAAYDDYNIWRDFPVLASFEHRDELRRWSGGENVMMRRVAGMGRDGGYAAAILFTTDRYSQISMRYFYRDWRGFSALALDVYNPDEPVELMIKVYDRQHMETGHYDFYDRYNGSRLLEHGWNQIRVPMRDIEHSPKERLMDLDQIRGLQFFLMDQLKPRTLFIDNLRLLR